MVWKHHKCSSLSFPLILESNKNSSLHHLQSTVYILCTVYIFCLKRLVLPSTVVWITCTQGTKSNCTKIILRSHGDAALFAAGQQQWHNVHFLKVSYTMFNVCWVINEVLFLRNVIIILINQPYNTWYYNYLTSWIVYIKSCSQHMLTVLLYEEYHHNHSTPTSNTLRGTNRMGRQNSLSGG
jgi:hypothetical protein